ncbi:amidase domain-containing protein [Agromyces sp. NPDC058136]|uniref:amidase domain-containing protein n=1 Tax=Agromyces sp. NPDC058136 TaxID=3346354 RepID=UPI0036D86179
MPERRRATFRAPGKLDETLLAEGATPEETAAAESADQAVAALVADAAEAVEALPVRRRSGFRAAKPVSEAPTVATESVESVESLESLESLDDADATSARPTAHTTAEASDDEPAVPPHQPRHRADHVRNRRPSGGARRLVALSCTTAIIGVTAFGAIAAAADDGSKPSADLAQASHDAIASGAGDQIVAKDVAVDDGPTITSELSTTSAPFTGGTQVTVTGESLDQVGAVSVAGMPATIVAADESAVTFAVPATDAAALGGVAVAFTDLTGQPVPVEQPVASIASTGVALSETTVEPTAELDALTLTYTSDPTIDAQLGYVLAHWNNYNTAEYTVLGGVDCANFTSQSLIARGWAMDAGWYYDRATGAMSPSWSSSTAMRDWLSTRPDLATALDDSQRGLVKVGDIAQFDWDGSGDRDHTAVVTRVEHTANGTRIWVGGHTKDADYWDVDEALANGGGSVSYFSLS